MNKRTLIQALIALVSSAAQAQPEPPRLPTAREARDNAPPAMQLERYRLRSLGLECSLPDGTLIETTPVSDYSDFLFLAIKSKKGPLILANEQQIARSDISYAVFSFYRECALHSLTKVRAEGPDDDAYPKALINAAECLAVLPTRKTMTEPLKFSPAHIADRLRDEYGPGASTSSELNRCVSPDYVRKNTRIGQNR